MPKRRPLSSKQDPVSEYGYTVIYEKLAEGGYQINVEVPEVNPGDAVPLQLRVGGITTTEQVTIAIRQ